MGRLSFCLFYFDICICTSALTAAIGLNGHFLLRNGLAPFPIKVNEQTI
jgi:hypothetical protein